MTGRGHCIEAGQVTDAAQMRRFRYRVLTEGNASTAESASRRRWTWAWVAGWRLDNLGERAAQGALDGRGLTASGTMQAPSGREQGRDGQSDSVGGHLVQAGKMALAHLLAPRRIVKTDYLGPPGVVEIGERGSLKAMWPFSPMPMAQRSAGWARSRSSYS